MKRHEEPVRTACPLAPEPDMLCLEASDVQPRAETRLSFNLKNLLTYSLPGYTPGYGPLIWVHLVILSLSQYLINSTKLTDRRSEEPPKSACMFLKCDLRRLNASVS